MAITDTITERGRVYGPYNLNSDLTQELKKAVRHYPGYHSLLTAEREAFDMIFNKLSRIIVGTQHGALPKDRVDSWHDVSGYAKLAEDSVGVTNPF